MESIGSLWETFMQLAITYGLKIIGAILILVVGRWVAKVAKRYTIKALARVEVDAALERFAASLTHTH